MSEELKEVKIKVASRFPPGDRWTTDSDNVVHGSLTDCLDYIFQKTNKRDFYISATNGTIHVLEYETVKPIEQRWSLYGEK